MSESNRFPTQPNSSHLLSKVIYCPEQWSDSVELQQTQQAPISAEVVEPIELSFSTTSIEATIDNEPYDYNPQPEQLIENIDWLTLAHKLRQQNRELLKTVVQLEQALAESHHNLHHQKLRSRNAEALLTQQTQQLTKTQGQVTHLTRELEQAQHLIQNQQLIVENFTQQLETTQQQTANLERECAFLKEDNNEKNQKLIFLEQQIQEFRSRLHRQQRYTLQYKAALDQCLDFPQSSINNFSTVSSIVLKERSIQPWSSNCQQLSPFPFPESKLEINSYEKDIDDKCSQPITVSFQEEDIDYSSSQLDEVQSFNFEAGVRCTSGIRETPYTQNQNLSNPNLKTDEDEVDIFLDEFFASFEPEDTSSYESITKPISSNWPSHLISPTSSPQKSSSKIVDLPNFLRTSYH